MKESPHEPLTAEQDKRETTICIVYASVVVFGMLCLLVYGMAWLSSVTVTAEDIYTRKRMQNQIGDLSRRETWMTAEYKNHIHRYFDGKIK